MTLAPVCSSGIHRIKIVDLARGLKSPITFTIKSPFVFSSPFVSRSLPTRACSFACGAAFDRHACQGKSSSSSRSVPLPICELPICLKAMGFLSNSPKAVFLRLFGCLLASASLFADLYEQILQRVIIILLSIPDPCALLSSRETLRIVSSGLKNLPRVSLPSSRSLKKCVPSRRAVERRHHDS